MSERGSNGQENGSAPFVSNSPNSFLPQTTSERSRRETFADKRIKRENDFREVYQNRVRVFNERLTLCCRATSPEFSSRLGLSVSKKVGKAFVRNRWKRLLREAFRKNIVEIPQGFDFIAIPQRQEKTPNFETICDDLQRLATRCVKKIQKRAEAENNRVVASQTATPISETEAPLDNDGLMSLK